ncbi:riboflavin kinase / FMN adenylyltransferase [Actinopolymorpha cephalotaxi]|uniref:Riboflavin biosynthesis protein n=1 Tax=Actinopolymorpha cephalotaxi TaxID=504797 RepID=A0A1I2RF31_9ACTN|nr:bifunctional riboflavin kinase/FAD synthetase [Actinopolymorpha cephalotaxi]NYH82307.1 riboflavin kinase/FMN adenylyltransferase [Actinopolymorpha cephalotaxi]SFG37217.1 riboflavin kinase / FMN adenylyltransferase [Actinopolymorpha cephalotaxi]
MQRWTDLTGVDPRFGPTVVTIGVFDGVHRGHQRVLARTRELAREHGARSVVVTFDPHPASVVRPEAVPPLLATVERRLELFEAYGMDGVVVVPFDKERSREPAEEFVRELVRALRPVAVVVGDDFRFGHKAAGNVDLLRTLGAELGFAVEGLTRAAKVPSTAEPAAADPGDPAALDPAALDPADPAGVPVDAVSSTAVRDRLAAGDVAGARALLGHTFRVDGLVVEGAHRGRELGFPTANVPASTALALPADGVYAGWLRVADVDAPGPQVLPAAISVGTNPQFGHEPRRVESYVLDRDDLDLYGRPVAVEFVDRVRGQDTYDSVDALVVQIRADVEHVRRVLAADPG